MPEEGFLRRWARRKQESREGHELPPEPESAAAPAPAHEPASAPAQAGTPAPVPAHGPEEAVPAPCLPTMDDVAALDGQSDFSAFVARGVDQAVRRSALKKLFADPHFKLMDGLDIYIDDYNKPSPVSDEMLASLSHAKSVFMRTLQDVTTPETQAAPAPPESQQTQQPPEQETQ